MLSDFKNRRRSATAVSLETAPPAAPAVSLEAPKPMADCWQHIGVWGNGSCVELKANRS